MASSRSQLGADIHEIDNTASRCGRLLDEVAGDAEAVERRDEIIAAMANTCKPYFGDVGDMTYLQWLQRYVELAIGDGTAPPTPRRRQPVAGRHLARPVRRYAQARRGAPAPEGLRADRQRSMTAQGQALLDNPDQAIAALLARYPDAETSSCTRPMCRRSSRCARRWASRSTSCPSSTRTCRWWRSDSLWQAHDARYTADQVHHSRHPVGGRHHKRRRAGGRTARPLRAGAIDDVLAIGRTAGRGGLPPPGTRRRHRPAGRGARRARRAVGRPHRHQPGAPHRRA